MLQLCHLRGGCVEGKDRVYLDTEHGHSPTLTAMEDETGKAERTQRQVLLRKGVPRSLISPKMYLVYKVFTIHRRKVDLEAWHWWIIRRQHEWNLRCTACVFD